MTLRELLASVGFKGSALDTAEAVARAESGGNASAHNTNAGTGDNSYGLFQINMLGAMGPARLKQYGLRSNNDLLNPTTNARVAYQMSNSGTNWSPWSTFKNGAYRAFLGTDAPVTGAGSSLSATSPGASSSTTATPAAFGLSGPDLSAAIVRVVIIGAAVAAGAGLVMLGVNKATGNPAGKAASTAATVAPLAVL